MTTKVTAIRRLLPADAEQARELLWKIDLERHAGAPDMLAWAEGGFEKSRARFDFLASDSFWLLAAERHGELIGYAAAARIPKASALVGTLYMDELYVLSEHRRLGIGSALVSEVHRIAKDLGYWRVRLATDPDDTALRRFYESLGFRDHDDGFFERDAR